MLHSSKKEPQGPWLAAPRRSASLGDRDLQNHCHLDRVVHIKRQNPDFLILPLTAVYIPSAKTILAPVLIGNENKDTIELILINCGQFG